MKDKGRLEGWIFLERGIREHWIYSEKPFSRFKAWIDLIFSANFQDKTIMVNGRPFLVRRGSFLTSTRKLAERWGWGKDKTSRFLTVLKDNGMIETATPSGTLITIVNYGFYQGRRDRKSDTRETATRQTRDTDQIQEKERRKNDKERKEEAEKNDPADDADFLTPDEYAKGKGEHGSTV